MREEGEVASSPLKEAITTSWRPILQLAGLVVIHNVGFYIVFTFLPSYFTTTLEFSKTDAFVSIGVASMVALILIPPLGALSDRIGRRPLNVFSVVFLAAFIYPFFLLLPHWARIPMVLLAICVPLVFGARALFGIVARLLAQ